MDLIKCKECGKELSKKASVCPNCGVRLNHTKRNIYIVIGILIILSIIIISIIIGIQDNKNTTYKADFDNITEESYNQINIGDDFSEVRKLIGGNCEPIFHEEDGTTHYVCFPLDEETNNTRINLSVKNEKITDKSFQK